MVGFSRLAKLNSEFRLPSIYIVRTYMATAVD